MSSLRSSLFFLTFLMIPFLWGCKDSSQEPEVPFPCENGKADGTYQCSNVGLYAHVSLDDLKATTSAGGVYVNDIWGWTDQTTGKNYALVGLADGVTFVDITDPENPEVVGKLEESSLAQQGKYPNIPLSQYPTCMIGIGQKVSGKTVTKGSVWRDHKVFNNHLFIVSDGQVHGMQVFDLTRLRDYNGDFMTFTDDALYDEFSNAHNIAINEETGFAYAVGITTSERCGSRGPSGSGLHIIDINDPKNPTYAGCYIDTTTDGDSYPNIAAGYVHDAQCVTYNGPDSEHQGKEICVSSAEGNVVIADVSDKSNPVTIGYNREPEMQYSHQGWLTEDHRYFLMNDEVDEFRLGRNTKTYIWDVQDLDNPEFVGFYEHDSPNTDHNLYIKGSYVYESNYKSGLRILQIENLANAQLREVAYFDTYTYDDSGRDNVFPNDPFLGSWSNYPFFDNEVVIVSDITNGLFILKPNL